MTQLIVPTSRPGTMLTKFVDPLRIPPVLRPDRDETLPHLTVRMRTTQVQLHSQLPPTTVWAYDGHFPGPTFDIQSDQRLRVSWVNEIIGKMPVVDVNVADAIPPIPRPANVPGLSGGTPNSDVAQLPAWTVVHLHGGRTGGGHDGWTENAMLRGNVQLSEYANDQPAMALWYHDHAMDITKFNVMAGLAGMYLIRDEEEAALGLPSGKYEVPLVICDRNFTTTPNGDLTGELLHKTAGGLPFFGPFTLVNGVIWPYLEVEPRWYRFRLLNASLTRSYRLVLLDQDDLPAPDAIRQIGTDSGLLPTPLRLPEQGLVLAPAERADLLIDFRDLGGQSLRLVSTAGQPFNGEPLPSGVKPGEPNPAILLPEPDVMQFRVSDDPVTDPFTLPTTVSSSFVRLSHHTLPEHEHRLLVLTQNPKSLRFELWEMKELLPSEPLPAPGTVVDGIIQIIGADGTTKTYQRKSRLFEDTVNWFVKYDGWEQWRILNLGANPSVGTPPVIQRRPVTHPIHLHLVRFQALSRDVYNITGFKPELGGTEQPIIYKKPGVLDSNEQGWKDVIRVGPGEIPDPAKMLDTGEIVSIAAQFSGATGRFMYHCHLLGHEDDGMMRPFVVTPAEVMKLDPDMGGAGMPM
ncbi:MAG TPA: multicopper oxidase domain-containing protein [Pseudonocardiaceae bacterium]|nr:multicopper oxidase domain-containing protein [Pseudonocardiaceae bacterium]